MAPIELNKVLYQLDRRTATLFQCQSQLESMFLNQASLNYHLDTRCLFLYVEVSTFSIASDAFSTFEGSLCFFLLNSLGLGLVVNDLLTKHKILYADYLENYYDLVFNRYQALLNSESNVKRWQALMLLGELLPDRRNFTTMTKYISNSDNLKLMMNILREKSRNIQFEAFHVLKES